MIRPAVVTYDREEGFEDFSHEFACAYAAAWERMKPLSKR
jgi:hypothetical protein